MTITISADVIRGGLYQRVSTTDQSVERQNTANLEAAAAHGWQAAEYLDDGLSASRFAGPKGGANREDYRRLVADVEAGVLGVVVLWEASRGNRQLTGWSSLLDSCRRYRVLIHVTSEDYTYDVTRARDWQILANAGIDAAMFSERLSVNIKSGKDAGMRAGRPQGGIAYGVARVYDPAKRIKAWLRDEPHPVTGPVAARIVREVAAGAGYQEIADAMNAEAIPTPSASRGRKQAAGRWTRTTITTIAGNGIYADLGMVTADESLQARDRLADTARKGERPKTQRFRYSQIMKCATCGGNVRGGNFRPRPGAPGADRYRCENGHASIAAAAADDFLDQVAVEWLSREDNIGLIGHADESAAVAARLQAAGYRQKMKEAAVSFAADRIDQDQLELITSTLKPKAEAAEQRARDAEVPSALIGLPDKDRAVVAARWEALSLPARKAAIRCLMPDLALLPGRNAPAHERIACWPGGV